MKPRKQETYPDSPVGVKHETNWGGIVIYKLIGVDRGELTAVRYRYEWGDDKSRMSRAKIRWCVPRRKASDGNKPIYPIPYFNTCGSRIYLDEVEACSPGWGELWAADYYCS
jgi:hypothetical protein